jgi:glucokinase
MTLLGIEIGGTKLQLGVGAGDGVLAALERFDVDPAAGAAGILEQIERSASRLIAAHRVQAIGVGFGGPIDAAGGRTVKSHHVAGWDAFPLVAWCQRAFGLPAAIGNDCDVAGLAEARFGAGRGASPLFYITVGTGIGGGLIIDGQIYRGSGVGAAEIGHLRPGLSADRPEETVESFAAGWAIAAAAQSRLADPVSHRLSTIRSGERLRDPEQVRQRLIEAEEADEEYAADLWNRCDGDAQRLTAKMVAQAAGDGNPLAQEIMQRALQALGWAVAQMINLVAPQVVVIGGGVSLAGEQMLFSPLRKEVERYLFPPFAGSYRIVPAALGEESVVHGALAIARELEESGDGGQGSAEGAADQRR